MNRQEIDPDSIKKGAEAAVDGWIFAHEVSFQNILEKAVESSFDFWLSQHEVSFPDLLEGTIGAVFEQWLENHSTEIIAEIAKHHHFVTKND